MLRPGAKHESSIDQFSPRMSSIFENWILLFRSPVHTISEEVMSSDSMK